MSVASFARGVTNLADELWSNGWSTPRNSSSKTGLMQSMSGKGDRAERKVARATRGTSCCARATSVSQKTRKFKKNEKKFKRHPEGGDAHRDHWAPEPPSSASEVTPVGSRGPLATPKNLTLGGPRGADGAWRPVFHGDANICFYYSYSILFQMLLCDSYSQKIIFFTSKSDPPEG